MADVRIKAVDFAKGVAILIIVIFHGYEAVFGWPGHDLFAFLPGGLVSRYFSSDSFYDPRSLLKLTALGYQGVSVFVVMAGFLAVWSTRDKEFNPYEYLVKRFCRIYPLYWIALTIVIIFNILVHGSALASSLHIYGMYLGYDIII